MKTFLFLYGLITAVALFALGILASLILLTADVAQGHSGSHKLVVGGVLNPLAHWSEGGMNYSFHGSVPSIWHNDINSAAAHLKVNTFATKFDYKRNSRSNLTVEYWPIEISDLNELPNIDTCDRAGDPDADDVACAWPVGTSGVGLWAALWGGGIVENIYRVKIALDPADVWENPSAANKVVKGTTLQSPRGQWPSSRVEKLLRHEFGHALGYFKHSNNSGDLMASPIGSSSLTDNDIWNLNRLYMHTSDADVACKTKISLNSRDTMRIGGTFFPMTSSGASISGRFDRSCPATAYDSNGLAHYYQLNHNVGRSQRFEISTVNGGPTKVRQYIHDAADNPYKRGAESPFDSSASTSKSIITDSKLVQVASTGGNSSLQYKLKITPIETDCIAPHVTFYRTAVGRGMLEAGDCLSSEARRGYSDFYRLTVTTPTTVNIHMTASIDTYLYLRKGSDRTSGVYIASDDDSDGTRNARIVRNLQKGEYTIEATSYKTTATGKYNLSVNLARTAGTPTPTATAAPTVTPTPTAAPTSTPVVTASLSPNPANVAFAPDARWRRFTVNASVPVQIVANPAGSGLNVEIATSSRAGDYCANGADRNDRESRNNGEYIYLAGCNAGTGAVEIRRAADNRLLQTYSLTISGTAPTPAPTPTLTPTPTPTPTPTRAASGPAPPTGLALRQHPTDPDELVLDYTRSHWSGSSAHYYKFELQRQVSGRWVHYSYNTGEVRPPANFDGLPRGDAYRAQGYRCRTARRVDCGAGSGWSSSYLLPAAVTPAQPTGLAGSAGNGAITLDWNDATHATGYQVQQWDGRARQWRTLPFTESHVSYSYSVSFNGSSAVVGRLTNGITYYHQVRAVNGSLYSGWTGYISTLLPSQSDSARGGSDGNNPKATPPPAN